MHLYLFDSISKVMGMNHKISVIDICLLGMCYCVDEEDA